MSKLKWLAAAIIVLAVIAYGVLFVLNNDQSVGLNLVFLTPLNASIATWVISAFVIGSVLGMLSASLVILQMRTEMFNLRRKLRAAEKADA